jgi:hypothetical protein
MYLCQKWGNNPPWMGVERLLGRLGKDLRQRMANSTADLWSFHNRLAACAKCGYLYLAFQSLNTLFYCGSKGERGAGVGSFQGRDGAFLAQFRFPIVGRGMIADQTAFLEVLAAVIIAVKIGAFISKRCAHNRSLQKTTVSMRGQLSNRFSH